jgi:tRNA-dihydrouridine synthase A
MAMPPVLSVAPMMDRTDRHCRFFLRQIAPGVRLYTEMVTAQAILHGDRDRLLGFDVLEHPVALQLGGSEPESLGRASRLGQQAGYDEINLNLGCPSDRVQSGRFGACLMLEPALVADLVAAMREACTVPVTVKIRTGVDADESEERLAGFIATVVDAGADAVIIHARNAILKGLTPKENREVPPLRYETVYRMKRLFPQLPIHLNGGVRTVADVSSHLAHVDGVMIGRQAYDDPWLLADLQERFLGGGEAPSREEVVRRMARYARRPHGAGTRLSHITRHMAGLYRGLPGARAWRQALASAAADPDALLRAARAPAEAA